MKVKVSELTGRALNYAVAFVHWGDPDIRGYDGMFIWRGREDNSSAQIPSCRTWKIIQPFEYNPQGNWGHGGPLIEKHSISIIYDRFPDMGGKQWSAYSSLTPPHKAKNSLCPLVSVCREIVHRKVGDEIDIPDELMEGE